MNWCNCANVSRHFQAIFFELFSPGFYLCGLRAMGYSWLFLVTDHARPMHFPYFPCQVPYKMRRQQLQAVAGRGNSDGEWMGMDWNISLYLLDLFMGWALPLCEMKPRVSFQREPTV